MHLRLHRSRINLLPITIRSTNQPTNQHTSNMSSASVLMYDNKFVDYYNYLFIDLAGKGQTRSMRMCIISTFCSIRCPNEWLAVNKIADTRFVYTHHVPVLCELLGSTIHGQPETIQTGKSADRVQLYSGVCELLYFLRGTSLTQHNLLDDFYFGCSFNIDPNTGTQCCLVDTVQLALSAGRSIGDARSDAGMLIVCMYLHGVHML